MPIYCIVELHQISPDGHQTILHVSDIGGILLNFQLNRVAVIFADGVVLVYCNKATIAWVDCCEFDEHLVKVGGEK